MNADEVHDAEHIGDAPDVGRIWLNAVCIPLFFGEDSETPPPLTEAWKSGTWHAVAREGLYANYFTGRDFFVLDTEAAPEITVDGHTLTVDRARIYRCGFLHSVVFLYVEFTADGDSRAELIAADHSIRHTVTDLQESPFDLLLTALKLGPTMEAAAKQTAARGIKPRFLRYLVTEDTDLFAAALRTIEATRVVGSFSDAYTDELRRSSLQPFSNWTALFLRDGICIASQEGGPYVDPAMTDDPEVDTFLVDVRELYLVVYLEALSNALLLESWKESGAELRGSIRPRVLEAATWRMALLEAEFESDSIADFFLAQSFRKHVHVALDVRSSLVARRTTVNALDNVLRIRQQARLNQLLAIFAVVASSVGAFSLFDPPLHSHGTPWYPVLGAIVVAAVFTAFLLLAWIVLQVSQRRHLPSRWVMARFTGDSEPEG